MLVYGASSYFSAMLGSAVDTICVRLRIFSYLSAMLGLTVDTYVALVVALAVAWFLPVCWLRFFRAVFTSSWASPWTLHRCNRCDSSSCFSPTIRCIRAVVSTKTLLLHLVRTTSTTPSSHSSLPSSPPSLPPSPPPPKESTAGGLDGWAWNEIKALPLLWFFWSGSSFEFG